MVVLLTVLILSALGFGTPVWHTYKPPGFYNLIIRVTESDFNEPLSVTSHYEKFCEHMYKTGIWTNNFGTNYL